MLKRYAAILMLVIMIAVAPLGCASKETPAYAPQKLRVGALSGAASIGMIGLTRSGDYDLNNIRIASTSEELEMLLTENELDIAAMPISAAAKLYNKTQGGIRIIAAIALGSLYIVDNSGEVEGIEDLVGKTLYASDESSTSSYILRYILKRSNIEDKVDIRYEKNNSELVNKILKGEITLAMISEPSVTEVVGSQGSNLSLGIAVDLNQKWMDITSTILIHDCLVVKADFAQAHEYEIKQFIGDYGDSLEFISNNPSETGRLMFDADIVTNAEIGEQSAERCNSVCIVGNQMRDATRNVIEILFGMDRETSGGELPNSDFYLTYEQ